MNELVKYCKCGCGQQIIIKKHHKYYGIPDYISGHNLVAKPKPRIKKVCPNCGKEFEIPPSLANRKFCSKKCMYEYPWKPKMPSKEELEHLYFVERLPIYKIAEMFGLSCTPVYKWFKYYGIVIKRGAGRSINIYRNYVPSKLVKGEVTDFELGYICGLIDGEGCIGIEKQKRKGGFMLRPYIHITNTNSEVIDYARNVLGGGIEIQRKKPPEKDVYVLRIYNTKLLVETLSRIKDKLILKKRQAELVLEFCQSRINGAVDRGLGYSDRELELYEELRKLNKRGR
jgi:hypothetical protein